MAEYAVGRHVAGVAYAPLQQYSSSPNASHALRHATVPPPPSTCNSFGHAAHMLMQHKHVRHVRHACMTHGSAAGLRDGDDGQAVPVDEAHVVVVQVTGAAAAAALPQRDLEQRRRRRGARAATIQAAAAFAWSRRRRQG
ncbi:Os10g0524850 [Oryza sativa Japonica Group]|uniref:Os10g0524850 protein n=1 Tax=Oryza sativa subsp. japonica TaxID=39947 RepID=A0A0P0XWE6_ORYSJ|nr:Os10g0524850 [Oryza sativa Japonica Group]